MATTNPLPTPLVECPLCDGPIAVEPAAATLTCAACRVEMDLAPAASPTSRATHRLAEAA
jgi:hypothetical protein